MKNIKNYAIALVALVIAISSVTLMSFTKKDIKKALSLSNQYWEFVGDNPMDPNDYNPSPQEPACEDGEEVCQIFAPSNNHPTNPKPQLNTVAPNHGSETVSDRISEALQTSTENETVTLKN